MLFKRKDLIFSPIFFNQAKATFLCDNSIEHKDVKAIAQFVGTRNSTQVRTHAQKYFMKLVMDSDLSISMTECIKLGPWDRMPHSFLLCALGLIRCETAGSGEEAGTWLG